MTASEPPAPTGPLMIAPFREVLHNIQQFGEHWSWRCGVQWTKASEGWTSGACRYDHVCGSWDELVQQGTAHLEKWHDIVPAGAVPDTGPPPLDFDVLVRSIVDSRYMWISMENAVDMAVTTARLLVDAGAVRIVANGQPVEVHGSLGAMRRLVHSRGITADERDHDVAVSRPVPPLEGRERDRLREVLDAAGLPRDRGWDDVLLALRSMGARAVPDTGQAPAPSSEETR